MLACRSLHDLKHAYDEHINSAIYSEKAERSRIIKELNSTTHSLLISLLVCSFTLCSSSKAYAGTLIAVLGISIRMRNL